MIVNFFVDDFECTKSFFDYIRAFFGPDIESTGNVDPDSEIINITISYKDGEKIAEIANDYVEKRSCYRVSIHGALALDPILYKYNYSGKSKALSKEISFHDFFLSIINICFVNLKLKPLISLLSLENYYIDPIRLKSETGSYRIDILAENFPITLCDDVSIVINESKKYTSVSFSGDPEIYEDWAGEVLDVNEFLASDITYYYIFKVLFDIVDPSAPEYPAIVNLYAQFKSIFEEIKKEFCSRRFFFSPKCPVEFFESTLKIVFPILPGRADTEPIEYSTILTKLKRHFLTYEFYQERIMKHRIHPDIEFNIHKDNHVFYVTFYLRNFKDDYQKFDTPLFDIFSFYKKHSKDPETGLFEGTENSSEIVFRVRFRLDEEYVDFGFLYSIGFRFINPNEFVMKKHVKDKEYSYIIIYNTSISDFENWFSFNISGVIKHCAKEPANFVYNAAKEVILKINKKKIVNPCTGKEIDIFSFPESRYYGKIRKDR